MTSKRSYKTLIAILGIFVLAIGGFAQGNHGGDDKHGGGEKHDNRGGGHGEQRGNDDNGDRGGAHGNRGNGNGGGRRNGGDDEQRVQQQQQWQQRQQQHQQHLNEEYVRQQQRQQYDQARQQQHDRDRQQQADQRHQQYQYDNRGDRGDRGKHNGWNNDGPRGNAYGLRGIWPGEFRGWRDPDNQARKAEKRNRRSDAYYYSDPLNSYYPVYQQPNYGYNINSGYSERPTRENIVRSIISSFFTPEPAYSNTYYAAPVYQGYTPAYNSYPQNRYYAGNNTPSYSPAYGYDQGYDQYGNSPMSGSQLFGGGGLKSSLLNIGLEMLQGGLSAGLKSGTVRP